MIDQSSCEKLAIAYVNNYLSDAQATTSEEKANALMKLQSLAAVITASEVGIDDAIERLIGTARFIARYKEAGK